MGPIGYDAAMARLEDHAIQRDKRFIVRLVIFLLAGLFGGFWMWQELTGSQVAGCAANSFGATTGAEVPAEGAPNEGAPAAESGD